MNLAIVYSGIAVIALSYVLTAAGLVLALTQIRRVKAAATAAQSKMKTFSLERSFDSSRYAL